MSKRPPTVCVDIDGVIATGGKEVYSNEAGWAYEKCQVIPEGKAMLEKLRENDIFIILHTARWESDRAKTEEWLNDNEILYDKLVMGKPSADLYIDDRNWPEPFRPTAVSIIGALVHAVKSRHGHHIEPNKE